MLLVGHPAAGAEFLIEVSGSPAIQFRGDCRVVSAAGATGRWRLKGTIPKSFKVKGIALSCTVLKGDARGRLTVRLLEDGRLVAAAETAAPFNAVGVRTSGPWGEARARRGVDRIPFSIRPGPSRGLVPPLSSSLVPSHSLPLVPPLLPGP